MYVCIEGVYDLSWRIGKIIFESKLLHINPLEELKKAINGTQIVYHGKITDVIRSIDRGFNEGLITLKNLDSYNNNNNNNSENKEMDADDIMKLPNIYRKLLCL